MTEIKDLKLKAFCPNVNIITNPEIIQVTVIKSKHLDSIRSYSFSSAQNDGLEPTPHFDIIGKTIGGTILIRFSENGHLAQVPVMELFSHLKSVQKLTDYDEIRSLFAELENVPQILVE